MADIAILIAISSFIITVLFFISLIKSRSAKKDEPVEEEEVRPPRPVRVNRENIARPLGARRNLNRRIVRHESEEEESDDPLADEIALPDGKIGAKKRKKLEMKAEKRAQRERDFQEREERKQRQAMLEEQRKKDEERERAEEAKKEEEERLKKEEEAKKELEEYLKLKECFVVEDEGYDETQADKESQDLLKDFIDFIKNTKVVLMDDLAARFKLKTQEAIERIQTLQSSGQLTGVIDDRGKFIYISQVELEAVAKFIRQRGRVSIAELVESSNILINLTPSVTT